MVTLLWLRKLCLCCCCGYANFVCVVVTRTLFVLLLRKLCCGYANFVCVVVCGYANFVCVVVVVTQTLLWLRKLCLCCCCGYTNFVVVTQTLFVLLLLLRELCLSCVSFPLYKARKSAVSSQKFARARPLAKRITIRIHSLF